MLLERTRSNKSIRRASSCTLAHSCSPVGDARLTYQTVFFLRIIFIAGVKPIIVWCPDTCFYFQHSRRQIYSACVLDSPRGRLLVIWFHVLLLYAIRCFFPSVLQFVSRLCWLNQSGYIFRFNISSENKSMDSCRTHIWQKERLPA